MKKMLALVLLSFCAHAQVKWKNVDAQYQPLPPGVHVYYTNDSLDGKPNIAYYLEADLKNKALTFTADTTYQRRLTPTQYFEKNNKPLVVVNTSFFEYKNNSNLNIIMHDGKIVSYNLHTIAGKGRDTFTYYHPFYGALGISKKRQADIAWIYTDSSAKYPYAVQNAQNALHDSIAFLPKKNVPFALKKWKMETAVGGGPVLLQNGQVQVSNDAEMKFSGKAINDKHPRTCIGYTNDGKLIILAIEGRHAGKAEGATLTQQARLLKEIGCTEGLNLDGGGSSCLLVNGKETITPSEKGEQRPVPSVLLIKN